MLLNLKRKMQLRFLAGIACVIMPAVTLTPLAYAQADNDTLDEVVVTGSRIARSGTDTPIPVVMLDAEAIESSGAINVGDVIREIPSIGPGLNTESTAVSFSAGGLNLIDLRRLGTERTLVLVNGKRQVGGQPGTTAVDLNTIPTPLIERIDVITGGASAVYGADAVSGVVNIILKDDFEGFQMDFQGGISQEGDADRYQISLTGGTKSDDGRASAVFHASYSNSEGIDFDARDTAISGTNWLPNPANTGPNDGIPDFIIVPNIRQLGGQQESAFVIDRGNGSEVFGFNPDGTVRPFQLGPSGLLPGNLTDGGEAPLGFDSECPQHKCQLAVPVERFLMHGSASYGLSDRMTAYAYGKFANAQTTTGIGPVFEIPPFTNNIPLDNPFVTDEVRDLHQQAGLNSVQIIRSDAELGLRGHNADRRLFQLGAGIKGSFGANDDWDFDVNFQHGNSLITIVRLNDIFQNRFDQALDAAIDPADGEIKCRSVIDGTAQDPGCVPVNLMVGGDALTPEVLSFVKIPDPTETAELRQTLASAIVTGGTYDIFGAGETRVAFGAEWREEHSRFTPAATQAGTPAGLENAVPPGSGGGRGLGFFRSTRRAVEGSFDVFELFGEALVPVLSGARFAEELNMEVAVRWADYSTAGSATSWKAGANWAPTDSIRFRAVRSRAVRAPNIGELFSPGTQGFVTVDDPCDTSFVNGGSADRLANCNALGITQPFLSNARTINIRTDFGGNPELEVESADTWTIGAVWTPAFLPDLAVTLDYYSIEIEDAINSFGTQQVLDSCVDLDTIDNVFCGNITRDAAGNLLLVETSNINVSNFTREGIDLEVRYSLDMGSGTLMLNGMINKLLTNETIVSPGSIAGGQVIDELGQIADPEWRARVAGTWQADRFAFNTTVTYMSNQVPDNTPATPEDNRATTGTGNHYLVDMQGRYDLSDSLTIRVGVDNAFDELPPNLPDTRAGGGGSFAGAEIFPITGRYYYVGLQKQF